MNSLTKNIKTLSFLIIASILGFVSCEKEKYSFGELKTPSNLALTTAVAGADATNPNGNGTGTVTITATADDAITYKVDFGDGTSEMYPSGTVTYKYKTPGTAEYVLTVNAVGPGGTISTISKKIKVFVDFVIPPFIVDALAGSGSKVWVTDKEAYGHFGVDDPGRLNPDPGVWWYAAGPNSREACAYDDEITFSKDANNNISMSVNNKGESFSIGGATSFYGFSGGDGCYAINTGGTKKLSFSDASTGFTSANSTKIQFSVPGNGIINFGTGGTSYEIISATATTLHLRNIGADGNAWYQKLKVKP
jgi:hypothetical protein